MFSRELYELDRNTVQYMIDEQQDTIDAQNERIGEQQDTIAVQKSMIDIQNEDLRKKQETIDELYKGTVNILRSLNMPDQEIIARLCTQYRMGETEARKYL